MKFIKIYAFFLLIILAFSGCNSYSQKKNNNIVIGAIFSSTGVAGDYGKKSLEGIRFAVNEVNACGGINGQKIEVIYEDAKSSPKDAISALNKLLNINNVTIIIGDVYSSTTKVLIDNLPNKALLFAPGASSPQLTNIKPNFIRNWTSDNFDGYSMAHVVYRNGIREIATLTQNNDYTISLNEAFVLEFKKQNGTVFSKFYFDGESSDYKILIQRLKNKNIKAVYLTALSKEMGLILKQAKEIGYFPQWFTNLTVNSDDCKKIAGSARNGVVFSKPYIDLENISLASKKFVEAYKKINGREPDETVCHAYDAMNIIAYAIKNKGTNTDSLITCINGIKNYAGLSGVTSFDGHGGVLKQIEVLKILNDSLLFVKKFSFNDNK